MNGFEVEDGLIESSKIVQGGPPKDGTPALTNPLFTTVAESSFLRGNDRVLGIVEGEGAKAYPFSRF